MDAKTLDQAIEVATSAANRAPEYKAETYVAVLISALIGPTRASLSGHPVPRVTPNTPGLIPEKQYSAAEFFASTTWSTEIEKVTLAAHFIERYLGMSRYSLNEVRSCLISAKVPVPSNASLAVLQGIQKGWIMELPADGDKQKMWALTQTGERRVQEMIEGGLKAAK